MTLMYILANYLHCLPWQGCWRAHEPVAFAKKKASLEQCLGHSPMEFEKSTSSSSSSQRLTARHPTVLDEVETEVASDDPDLSPISDISCGTRTSETSSTLPEVPRWPQDKGRQTITIFDWDDTLLCTSWLDGQQHQETLCDETRRDLRRIYKLVKQLLQKALLLGPTYIVTNAVEGWVEKSASMYMPELEDVLKQIQVVSAQALHGEQYPQEIGAWKRKTFAEMQSRWSADMETSVIVLGDSDYEIDAAQALAHANCVIKTVKFREKPSARELLLQLQVIEQKFERIASINQGLKIGLHHLGRMDLVMT